MRTSIAAAASAAVLLLAAVLVTAGAGAQAPPPVPAPGPYVMPASTPANVRKAVESPERTAEMTARDYWRKPAEILTAAGIKEGDHIAEVAGFGQYFTTMLVAAVGPRGMIDIYDLPYTERFAGEASRMFDAAHDNAAYHQEDYNTVTLPKNLDGVYIVLYYHDLKPANVDTAALNKKIFEALKPGGTYLIIDHKAEDGSGWRDAATIHRMGVDTIKQEVLAAGFQLALDSNLLANPKDDRKQMVFAPGTRGTTDQAFFIFRKPAR
ncbi:MAG TPA: methyltransferase [Gammaproteobacteria bacterium]|nr:methyltransferase [Gammaproteobacteria bacterium]